MSGNAARRRPESAPSRHVFEARASNLFITMQTLLQDIRFGMRLLRQSPGVAALAIFTLAIGIGSNTAIFSVLNAVLIQPLPYPHADRIVIPWHHLPKSMDAGGDVQPWGGAAALHFEKYRRAFASFGAFQGEEFNLTGAGDPIRLDGIRASAGFFPALGVKPLLGRTYTEQEDRPGNEREVVLAYDLWQRQFGGDAAIVGRAIHLNGVPYAVVGVMPREFAFPRGPEMPDKFRFTPQPELWTPLALTPPKRGDPDELAIIGRLNPSITLAQAQAEMDSFERQLDEEFPTGRGWFGSRVEPLASQISGGARRPLSLLQAAVALVLPIACANVANLPLARSARRKKEVALRAARGAGRGRIVRQLLAENLPLASAGGFGGVLIAGFGIELVKRMGIHQLPRMEDLALNPAVLAFSIGTTIAASLLTALAPALGAARFDLHSALKESGRGSTGGPGGERFRTALLTGEIALTLVLLVTAGLFGRSFLALMKEDPGFNPSRVLAFELTLPGTRYSTQDGMVAVYRSALDRLSQLRGVEAAGIVNPLPMSGGEEWTVFGLIGRPTDPIHPPLTAYTIASPGYFSAIGTRILHGRAFRQSDTADSLPVTIISDAFAQHYFQGEDPLGKQVRLGTRYPAITIVGVAAGVKRFSMSEAPGAEMYVPYTQRPYPAMNTMQVVVRTSAAPEGMASSVRGAIHGLDAELPVAKLNTLDSLVSDAMARPRFSMALLQIFGLIAMALAAVGLYGVISCAVAQRTREIGIRMALGARPAQIVRMVLQQCGRVALLGAALGVAGALAVGRAVRSMLFETRPADPLTFVAVTAALFAVSAFACYLPARRAMRVDPLIALREE